MGGLAKGLAIIELFGIERPQLTVADAANGAGMTRAAAAALGEAKFSPDGSVSFAVKRYNTKVERAF